MARHRLRLLPVLHGRLGELCPAQQNTGYSIDGGYAEYAIADARFAGPVPDGIDPMDTAPLTCAGVTTYKGIEVFGARSTDLVSVVGISGPVVELDVADGLVQAIRSVINPDKLRHIYPAGRRSGEMHPVGH